VTHLWSHRGIEISTAKFSARINCAALAVSLRSNKMEDVQDMEQTGFGKIFCCFYFMWFSWQIFNHTRINNQNFRAIQCCNCGDWESLLHNDFCIFASFPWNLTSLIFFADWATQVEYEEWQDAHESKVMGSKPSKKTSLANLESMHVVAAFDNGETMLWAPLQVCWVMVVGLNFSL